MQTKTKNKQLIKHIFMSKLKVDSNTNKRASKRIDGSTKAEDEERYL